MRSGEIITVYYRHASGNFMVRHYSVSKQNVALFQKIRHTATCLLLLGFRLVVLLPFPILLPQ